MCLGVKICLIQSLKGISQSVIALLTSVYRLHLFC